MWYIKNTQSRARKKGLTPQIFTVGRPPQTESDEDQGVLCFIETNVSCLCQQLMASLPQ